jgi:opacity protein-like surface antigen
MRTQLMLLTLSLAIVAPAMAQERGSGEAKGYVTGLGGFVSNLGQRSGDVLFEGGVRIAPHLKVIGDIGRFGNLQNEFQPSLDTAAASITTPEGLTVSAVGTVHTWYGLGGLRYEVPTGSRIVPFVLGGFGVAHLNPSPQFNFTGGALPDGSVPTVGTDVTPAVIAAGLYVAPQADSRPMMTLGGGIDLPVAPHLGAEVGYRYSRISADTTLSPSALDTHAMTFGLSYRF